MNTPDFVPASRPMVADLRGCEAWLGRAALGDPREACAAYIELLDRLEDAPPGPASYLEILERLRHPMLEAIDQQLRRFSAKALPLAHSEDAAFTQVTDLWLALLRAWQKLHGAAGLPHSRALLGLRATECAAGLIGACFAARREVDAAAWRWLHQCYAHAERHHFAETEVGDRSCLSIYTELLMVYLAHPYGLSQRELEWTRRWARRWAPKVELWRSAENGGGLAVDLEGAAGPAWTAAGVPGALRYLDCSEVALSIRRRQKRLAEGADPGELGLGRDYARPAVDELLASLARCWSDAPQARQFPRRMLASRAELAAGLPNIFHALAGAPMEAPGEAWAYSRRDADQMHTFGRALEQEKRERPGLALEAWQTVDESANGFQLARSGAGGRIAHRQLVALRPSGGSKFILCEVRWLRRSAAGALAAGVKALPGIAQAGMVREAASADRQRWSASFVLPVAEGLPPALVIAAGLYQSGRELELSLEGRHLKILLTGLRQHGHDFDWVDFSAA